MGVFRLGFGPPKLAVVLVGFLQDHKRCALKKVARACVCVSPFASAFVSPCASASASLSVFAPASASVSLWVGFRRATNRQAVFFPQQLKALGSQPR